MEGGQYHHPSALVVAVSGGNAARISYAYMYRILAGPVGGLGINGVASLSRYETKTKRFVRQPTSPTTVRYTAQH